MPRVGFEETFVTADGWKTANAPDLKSIELKKLPTAPAPFLPAGTLAPNILFTTVCGALNENMHRDDWPEWPKKPFQADTTILKKYDAIVDLDVYHYLVIDLPIRGCNVVLAVNGVSLPIAYTTGLRAYDLKTRDHANLKGKQPITISMEFLNTSGSVGFNAIRLVASLTDDEQKTLMPAPVEYKKETPTIPPYQNLEALNRRAGRARHAEYEGQLCVYKDSLCGATVWKLTDQPGDQHFHAGDSTLGWSADGRFFQVNGGRDGKNVFDFQTRKWLKTALVAGVDGKDHPLPDYAARWDSKKHPGLVYGYKVDYSHAPDKIFRFFAFDTTTGKETEFAQWKTQAKWAVRELATSADSDKAVVGLRESAECCIVDPDQAIADLRAQPITLSTRLKGLHFGKKNTTLIWHNCYTYEQWERVVVPTQPGEKAGDTHLAYYTGGSHAGGGGGFSLNHYEGLTLIRPDDLTDWMAGDQVKIFAHYKHPFESDYGALTAGGRYWVVNGSGGDVANQILMVERDNPANVVRLAGMNTSRNDWSTNTYTLASPDGKRVAWVSDQLGDGDVYIVDVPKGPEETMGPSMPAPPTDAKVEVLPHGVLKLTWKPSAAKNLARTEIFALTPMDLRKKRVQACANDTVIGAVLAQQPQQFFDWGGGAPGESVRYELVAVDGRGYRSPPAVVEAAWPALPDKAQPVTVELQVADLLKTPRELKELEVITRGGRKMVAVKMPAAGQPALQFRTTFDANFSVPAAGDYSIWVRYSPGYRDATEDVVFVGNTVIPWKIRCPYRPMSGTLAAPAKGEFKVFVDRLAPANPSSDYSDEFTFTQGQQYLTFGFAAVAKPEQRTAIETVWITNDPSFRPPGYDPRADFKK